MHAVKAGRPTKHGGQSPLSIIMNAMTTVLINFHVFLCIGKKEMHGTSNFQKQSPVRALNCKLCTTVMILLYVLCLSLLASSRLHALAISCPVRESDYDADVLILGAGMSGISAARSLHENGIDNFMIIEARDRIGGRMRSKEFGGIRVELGEQWVFGIHFPEDPPKRFSAHNDIQQLLERCGIKGLNPDSKETKAFHAGGKIIDNKTIDDGVYEFGNMTIFAFEEGQNRMKKGLPDISVRQALIDNGWVPDTPFKKLMEWDFFDFLYQQLPETASLYNTIPNKPWQNFGSDMLIITDQRGSEHLLYCMAEDFRLTPNDHRLKLNTKVSRIHNGDTCVCVETISSQSERKTYCAKRALVTFSIGVLQSLRAVRFIPRLPQWKQKAVNMFRMNHLLRLFLKYKERFWEDVTFIDRLDKVKGRYAAFQPLDHYRYNISHSHHIIVWTVIGEQADFIAKQPISEIKSDIKTVFQEMYPDTTIPEPEDVLVTDWKNDPLYFGSFPNKAVGATNHTYDLLTAPVGRLFFSGDGMDKVYSGQLHGAYYTGVNAGLAIAKAMKME